MRPLKCHELSRAGCKQVFQKISGETSLTEKRRDEFGHRAFMRVRRKTEVLLGVHAHAGTPRQFPHASDITSQINERIRTRNPRRIRSRSLHRV